MNKIVTKKMLSFLALSAMAYAANAQSDMMQESVHKPVESLSWFATGIGPMQAAVAYGDMNKGAHGTFLKMPKGFVSPVHMHTHEYHAVVISGTIVNSEVGKPDIKMRPGSYWFQVGNVKHVTKCVSDSGCTVFLSQPENFDFVPDESAVRK